MKAAVVDASVAVKWTVPEDHSEAALRLLTEGTTLHAPGHWLAEVSTALWAKCAIHAVLTRDQVEARVAWLSDLTVQEQPIRLLVAAATVIAFDLRLTVYDTLYLALAEAVGVPLVTADRKLHQNASGHARYCSFVVWIADLPHV